jgi:hypothetical protein
LLLFLLFLFMFLLLLLLILLLFCRQVELIPFQKKITFGQRAGKFPPPKAAGSSASSFSSPNQFHVPQSNQHEEEELQRQMELALAMSESQTVGGVGVGVRGNGDDEMEMERQMQLAMALSEEEEAAAAKKIQACIRGGQVRCDEEQFQRQREKRKNGKKGVGVVSVVNHQYT